MQQGKRFQRPRRDVSHASIVALSPFFRYSASRDAYVLRAVGNARGPVLREAQHPHDASEDRPAVREG